MSKRSNEELCLLAQQGDEEACAELLLENDAYIVSLIKKLPFNYQPHMEDLMQCGYLGMLRGVEKFDPEKGNKFLTYATSWIEKELKAYMNKELGRAVEEELPDIDVMAAAPDEEDAFSGQVKVNTSLNKNPLEQAYIRQEQKDLMEDSLKALAPREREFALHRYGLEENTPMGREKMMEEYSLPMAEVKRLERRVHEFVRECMSNGKLIVFEGDSIDPKIREQEAEKACEKLFADPGGSYIHGLLDAFDADWETEFPKE